MSQTQTFDLPLMRTYLKVVDASKLPNNTAVASFSMIAPSEFCNRTGMLHGGAVAMIVDMATTLAQAPLAAPGYWEFGGVSRTLTVTYLRPIPKDTEILIVCEVLQVGRALGESLRSSRARKLDRSADLYCSDHPSKDVSKTRHGPPLLWRTQ